MAVTISYPQQHRDETNYTISITGNDNVTIELLTTVTNHPGVVREWLRFMLQKYTNRRHRNRLLVGLALQWNNPSDHPAATLQLCIGRRCLIFQLCYAASSPLFLRRVLADPSFTFVGLWNYLDAHKLRESHHGLEMVGGMPIDLREHVVDDDGMSMNGASIAEIAEEVIGVNIGWDRRVSRSDWEVEVLWPAQVQQAAVKAFVAYSVGTSICAWELNPNL